jgi:hypothetical protein
MVAIFNFFEEQVYNQYALIAMAVLIVVSIKIFMAKKAYRNKLTSFVHPDTVVADLKKKVTSIDQAQDLLAFNIHKLPEDESRMRNIAFLMVLLKSYGAPLKPLKSKLVETFAKIEHSKLQKANKTYKEFILNEIEEEGK